MGSARQLTVRSRDIKSVQNTAPLKMKTLLAAVLVASLLAVALSAPNPEAKPEYHGAKPEEGGDNSEFGENDNVQVQQLQLGGAGVADAEINQAMLEGGCGCNICPCAQLYCYSHQALCTNSP